MTQCRTPGSDLASYSPRSRTVAKLSQRREAYDTDLDGCMVVADFSRSLRRRKGHLLVPQQGHESDRAGDLGERGRKRRARIGIHGARHRRNQDFLQKYAHMNMTSQTTFRQVSARCSLISVGLQRHPPVARVQAAELF